MIYVAIAAVALLAGMILSLHFQSKRPINVNVSAHAEAHGGSANVSSSTAQPTKSGSGIGALGLIKAMVLIGILAFCLIMVGGLINKISEPAKVIMPTQVPQSAPNIIVPPHITIQPAPVTVTPITSSSPLDTLVMLIAIVAEITVIITAIVVWRYLRKRMPQTVLPFYPEQPPGSISAEEVVPGLFTQK